MSARYYTYDHRFSPPESSSAYASVEEALLQAASDTLTGSAQPIRIEDASGKTIRNERQIGQAAERLAVHREKVNRARDTNHPNPRAIPVGSGEYEAVNG